MCKLKVWVHNINLELSPIQCQHESPIWGVVRGQRIYLVQTAQLLNNMAMKKLNGDKANHDAALLWNSVGEVVKGRWPQFYSCSITTHPQCCTVLWCYSFSWCCKVSWGNMETKCDPLIETEVKLAHVQSYQTQCSSVCSHVDEDSKSSQFDWSKKHYFNCLEWNCFYWSVKMQTWSFN